MTTESNTAVAISEASVRPERIGRWVRWLRWPALALFFAIATIIQTWPLAKHASDSINTWWFFPFDAWAFLWDLWWVKHSVLGLQNPYHTDLLLYPQGADLYLSGQILITGILSIPFQVITGNLILSWNLVALLSFALAGLGTYALSYRVTGNHFAGLLSGFIFALSPFMMMRLGGHWNIVGIWPIPFFMLFLLRFRDSGRVLDAAVTGFFWAILTLNWIEFAVDATLFMGIFFVYWTIVYLRRANREALRRLWLGGVVIAVVWFVLSGPVLLGTIRDVQDKDYVLPSGDEVFSADVLTFITPSPLWGPGTAPLAGGPNPNHLPVGSIENTAYMGGMPLLLATVSLFTLRRNPHRALIWVITFFTFLILSLGPYLYIDDSRHHSLFGLSFSVPMPYQIFDRLPLVGNRRVPVRMVVFAMLALSILAGIGLDLIMSTLRRRWRRLAVVVAPALALVVLGVVWLEYWNPPVYVSKHYTPEIFREIGAEDGDFTVVHAPLGRRNGFTISGHPAGGATDSYYQTIHGKQAIGGYISRTRTEGFAWFLEQPGLHFLACPTTCGSNQPQGNDANVELVKKTFKDNKIRYVAVHRIGPDGMPLFFVGDPEIQALDNYLGNILKMKSVYSDPGLSVYRFDG